MIDKGEENKIMTNSFSEYAMLYDKIMLQTSLMRRWMIVGFSEWLR